MARSPEVFLRKYIGDSRVVSTGSHQNYPEKSSDADLLREMIGFTAQRLMERKSGAEPDQPVVPEDGRAARFRLQGPYEPLRQMKSHLLASARAQSGGSAPRLQDALTDADAKAETGGNY